MNSYISSPPYINSPPPSEASDSGTNHIDEESPERPIWWHEAMDAGAWYSMFGTIEEDTEMNDDEIEDPTSLGRPCTGQPTDSKCDPPSLFKLQSTYNRSVC